MTGKDANDSTLYPHSTDFTGRPPPPPEGYGWGHIKSVVDGAKSAEILRRTDKGQYEYEQWQSQIDYSKYRNAGEFIVFTILNWPDLKDPAEVINSATENMSQEERYSVVGPRLTFRVNHYPFPVHSSIQYFVLWSTRDMSLPCEKERLNKFLELQIGVAGVPGESTEIISPAPGMKKQWMWFVNPVALRSVANIHHMHVFVRDIPVE